MLDITVCKFGGSSLADADCFRRVGDIIRSDPRRRYIVVSAPGKCCMEDIKITDLLIAAHDAAGPDQQSLLDSVRSRFCRISVDLGLHPPYAALSRLRAYARQGRDAIASRGEYISALLLAEYLNLPFIDSADIFIFRDGRLDTDATYRNLRSLTAPAVIPGFYGSDPYGNIVTFPRGGSDITAAHVAAATDAALYENWTDVDGFYSADPAIVHDARFINSLSCIQARLITYLGAGILHYESVAPAADAGIPILIKNTFHPEKSGTLISPSCKSTIPCVAFRPIGGNRFLLSCTNLSSGQEQKVLSVIPSDLAVIEYGGTISCECNGDELHKLTSGLHSACFG